MIGLFLMAAFSFLCIIKATGLITTHVCVCQPRPPSGLEAPAAESREGVLSLQALTL